jgi:hypothetical protein
VTIAGGCSNVELGVIQQHAKHEPMISLTIYKQKYVSIFLALCAFSKKARQKRNKFFKKSTPKTTSFGRLLLKL